MKRSIFNIISCFSLATFVSRFVTLDVITSATFFASRDCTTSRCNSSIFLLFATPSLHKLSSFVFSLLISSFITMFSFTNSSCFRCNTSIYVIDCLLYWSFEPPSSVWKVLELRPISDISIISNTHSSSTSFVIRLVIFSLLFLIRQSLHSVRPCNNWNTYLSSTPLHSDHICHT